jgi:hypothetical protein
MREKRSSGQGQLKMWTQKLKTKTHTRPTAALRAAGKKDNFFNELKAVHRDKNRS